MSLKHTSCRSVTSEEALQENVNHLPFGRISQRVRRGGQGDEDRQWPQKTPHSGDHGTDRNSEYADRIHAFKSSPTKGIFDINTSRPMYSNRTDSQLGLVASGTVMRDAGHAAFTRTCFSREDLPHPNKLRRKASAKQKSVPKSWPGKNGVTSHINNLHRKQRSEARGDPPYTVTSQLTSSHWTVTQPVFTSPNQTIASEGSCSWESSPWLSQCRAVRPTPLRPSPVEQAIPAWVWSAPQLSQHRQPPHHQPPQLQLPTLLDCGSTSTQAVQGDLFRPIKRVRQSVNFTSLDFTSNSPTFTYPRRRSEE